jgi:hypothetical protein
MERLQARVLWIPAYAGMTAEVIRATARFFKNQIHHKADFHALSEFGPSAPSNRAPDEVFR